MISGYNGQAEPVNSLMQIVARQLKIFGILVTALRPKYDEWFYKTVPKEVAEGKLKYSEDPTTGLQYAGHALLDVLTGKNKAKSFVIVAEE